MIPEYNLSKEPIRIDLLIIKNDGQAKKIENEIGHIMKKYNVIEYKSPEDSMTIDAFCSLLNNIPARKTATILMPCCRSV